MTEKRYFAAANTTSGFKSYYTEVFGKCDRIYIIKGGSGTGKSRFMRECARAVSDKEIEYFHCSFDPHSLDGIIIDGEVAIIDGTAPHVYEPTIPGARENIVDLGRFWDSDRLKSKRDMLSGLMGQKKNAFLQGYAYLRAYGELDGVKQRIIASHVDRQKISASAAKLVSELEAVADAKRETRIISALGRDGRVDFETFEASAEKIHRVYNEEGAAHVFLTQVISEAERMSVPISVSYDPLFAERPNAVLVGNVAISATENPEDDAMQEYFGKDFSLDAERVLRINQIQNELVGEAVLEFKRASNIHFGIEEIYVGAMDFGKKEEFTRQFISELNI